MAIKDLITGTDNKTLSSSQTWFTIIHIAITICYIAIGYNVAKHVATNPASAANLLDSFGWFTLIVSGIITGNKFANKLAELKLGKQNDTTTSTQILETDSNKQ
jgi:hypothetical protein